MKKNECEGNSFPFPPPPPLPPPPPPPLSVSNKAFRHGVDRMVLVGRWGGHYSYYAVVQYVQSSFLVCSNVVTLIVKKN